MRISAGKPRLGIIALNRAIPYLLKLVDTAATGSSGVGGIEVQVLALARALAARGWPVTLLVADWGQPDGPLEVDGMTVIKAHRRGSSALAAVQLANSLRRVPVDIWLLQGIHGAAGVASFVAHATGRRFVFWLASDTDAMCTDPAKSRLPRSQRRLAAYGLRTADALVAQTNHQCELVRERLRREATVIPNAWPVDALKPGRAGKPTALWVANLRWEKRPEMVLELAQAAPEIQFLMVGGPMSGNERLHEDILARQHDYDNFQYLGFVPFEHVGRHFETADVFINTSVVEGFPNTFLQAWDAQLPIVASFDPDDTLKREALGYHAEAVEPFAEHLRALMADEALRRSLGARGKQYLRDNFSMEVVIPRLEALLTDVAAGRHSSQT